MVGTRTLTVVHTLLLPALLSLSGAWEGSGRVEEGELQAALGGAAWEGVVIAASAPVSTEAGAG